MKQTVLSPVSPLWFDTVFAFSQISFTCHHPLLLTAHFPTLPFILLSFNRSSNLAKDIYRKNTGCKISETVLSVIKVVEEIIKKP